MQIPDVLKHAEVDEWIKCVDKESFAAARRLIRTEGLLCGGSSGSAMAAALKYLKSDEGWKRFGGVEGANVVVLLADSWAFFFVASLIELMEWLQDSELHHGGLGLGEGRGAREGGGGGVGDDAAPRVAVVSFGHLVFGSSYSVYSVQAFLVHGQKEEASDGEGVRSAGRRQLSLRPPLSTSTAARDGRRLRSSPLCRPRGLRLSGTAPPLALTSAVPLTPLPDPSQDERGRLQGCDLVPCLPSLSSSPR